MTGILVFLLYLTCGCVQIFALCPKRPVMIRLWLGCVLGIMEQMWLPLLFAFVLSFNLSAQLFAIGLEILVSAALVPLIIKHRGMQPEGKQLPLSTVLILMIPLAVLVAYLQYTHNFREADGALYVGQSTYGDLCMHASFITGLIGQRFPFEYTLLPGTTLGYPFLVDALSSGMYLLGTPLSLSLSIPGTVMTLLVYFGFLMFAFELTHRKGPAVLSFVLLLFCGGLGFLYTLDLSGQNAFEGLKNAINGYYQAPANMPEYNLYWVNPLCDLLIPQRTLMAGWMTVIPALYMLVTSMRSRKTAEFVALGFWSGPMVMIHTHSFLALGVISLGALISTLIADKKHRLIQLLNFGLYGIIACVIALPQVLVWTFPQTFDGGSLKLFFNWVNNNGNGMLTDGYFWFWIKNVGIMFIFIPVAAISIKNRAARALALGSLILFVLADNVVFQPNTYDNNKLFLVAYLATLPIGCLLIADIYDRLNGIKLRWLLAAGFIFICTASGAISIVRECVSNYQIFGEGAVSASEWINENTDSDSTILTSNNHNNVPSSLCGRKIVCGSSLYLYFHGLDYDTQEADAKSMLSNPEANLDLFEKYSIDYVYVSAYEKNECHADEAALSKLFTLVYSGGPWYDTVNIYKVNS